MSNVRLSDPVRATSYGMNKKLLAYTAFGVVIVLIAIFFRTGQSSTIVWDLSNGGKLLLPLIVITAIVDSINPCAFSILLLTIAFLFSMGRMRSSVLKIGGLYITGIFVAYFLIGLGLIHALHIFNTPHFMAKVGAWLLIILGLINVINDLFPAFPIKLRVPHAAHHKIAQLMEKGTLSAVFFLGMLVGLCEFPCPGGPYLTVIGLLHDQATYIRGVAYLLFYNVVFISPLVILLFIASNKGLLDKVQSWQKKESRLMRFGGGIAMIILGLLILLL